MALSRGRESQTDEYCLWQSAKLPSAIPSVRFVIMAAYYYVSPSLDTDESSLMDYLHRPRDRPNSMPSGSRSSKLEVR